jgi:hypothetical protein
MKQALEMALDWIKKQPEETPESKYDVDTHYVVIREIEAALAQPEQEPVPWLTEERYAQLHTAQRTWVGLTDEEIEQLHTAWVLGGGFRQLCNAIEAKLKEKNT